MKVNLQQNNNKIAFNSKRSEGQSFEDFKTFAQNSDICQNVSKIISCEDNYISEGKNNKTYLIPDSSKFILRVPKKGLKDTNGLPELKFYEVLDAFPNMNVGQPIAKFYNDIEILIKQEGEQNGISYGHRYCAGKGDIPRYISGIKKLSEVPYKGYKRFTDEVKEIFSNGYSVDYLNSNNFLITKDEINIVDLIKRETIKKKIILFPSKDNLFKGLIDNVVFVQLFPKMNNNEKNIVSENIMKIFEMLTKSMKDSKLSEKKNFSKIANFIQDTFMKGENKKFYSIMNKIIRE